MSAQDSKPAVEFKDRIAKMNEMYRLPDFVPGNILREVSWTQRQTVFLEKFQKTLLDEVHEIQEIVDKIDHGRILRPIDMLVELADLLADVIVYCRSEALKYGIPLEQVLDIVMDSNESKLGADGNPIYDENGKFLKGPNHWKPESKIQTLLMRHYTNGVFNHA